MIKAAELLTGANMDSPFLAIHDDVHGIGYSVYFYQEFMSPERSTLPKACAVEGVKPTSESIQSREYPLATEVYVVIRKDLPAGHPARRLRDWMLSTVGQKMVSECGYVPMDAS